MTIAAWPNPTSDLLNLQVSGQGNDMIRIRIMDLQGRIVMERNVRKNDVNIVLPVSGLNAGMYILNVEAGQQHERLKVIVR